MPRIVPEVGKRPIHNLEIYLNDKTLQDIIAAHLYAMSIVDHREEIFDVCLGDAKEDGTRSITFKVFKQSEPELIIHK